MWRRRRPEDVDSNWPLRIVGETPAEEPVVLRPLVLADEKAYFAVRRADAQWLAPWDATSPVPREPRTFADVVRAHDEDARAGRALPMAIEVEGRLVGQVNVSGITRGSFWSCSIGYWISKAVAGRWITPTAVAMIGDHCFGEVGLHRLEINIRPENVASLAVVRKLGFREEGLRQRFLHIDGEWRDHRSFAVTIEDLDGGSLMARCAQSSQESLWRHTDPAPQG